MRSKRSRRSTRAAARDEAKAEARRRASPRGGGKARTDTERGGEEPPLEESKRAAKKRKAAERIAGASTPASTAPSPKKAADDAARADEFLREVAADGALEHVDGDDLDAMKAKAAGVEDGSVKVFTKTADSMTDVYDSLQSAAGRAVSNHSCAWRVMHKCTKPACAKCGFRKAPPDGIRELMWPKLSERMQKIISGN